MFKGKNEFCSQIRLANDRLTRLPYFWGKKKACSGLCSELLQVSRRYRRFPSSIHVTVLDLDSFEPY